MANIDFPTSPTTGQKYTFAGITYVYSPQGVWTPASSVTPASVPQGRLTLQSAVPVMTTTSTGHTVLFYTPYVGNHIPIWDGVQMTTRRFDELQGNTTDFVHQPSAIAANEIDDWFVWYDKSIAACRLVHGPAWADNVTRTGAGSLLRQEGLLVNAFAITNGPAQFMGTYVGTTMANTAGQLDWIYPQITNPPTAGFFGVWNMYFRAQVGGRVGDLTASWTYNLAAPRPSNGKATCRVDWVSGMQEDNFSATTFMTSQSSPGGGVAFTGVGYDASNAYTGAIGITTNVAGYWSSSSGRHTIPAFGKHSHYLLESINADGYTQTIWGGVGPVTVSGSQISWTLLFFDGRF